jgi:hypothetical protein
MYRILAALLAATVTLGSAVQAAPSLASLDIVAADVPRVVRLVKTWNLTPALADYINVLPHGTSAKQGIVAGHAEFYECKSPAVCLLTTQIYLFKTQTAAQTWYFMTAIPDLQDVPTLNPSWAIPPFGDERFGQSIMGPKFPLSLIVFRSGRYGVLVDVESPTKILSLHKIIQLAGIINTHIQHAH